MAKPVEIEKCRERPSCGCAVLDRAEHRRWHERVFILETRPSRQPFVGVDVKDPPA